MEVKKMANQKKNTKRKGRKPTISGMYKKWGYKIDEPPRRHREEQLERGKRSIQTDTNVEYRRVWENFWKKPSTDEWVYHEPEFSIFVRTGFVAGEHKVDKETLKKWEQSYCKDREDMLQYWKEVQREN